MQNLYIVVTISIHIYRLSIRTPFVFFINIFCILLFRIWYKKKV